MAQDSDPDSVLNINYFLDVGDAEEIACFDTIEGGDMTTSYIQHLVPYNTGESANWLIPTTSTVTPISMSNGFVTSDYLYKWYNLAAQGRIFEARRHCSIRVMAYLDGSYEPITYFHLYDAWVSSISNLFDLQSKAIAKVSRIKVTIVAEYIERVDEGNAPSRRARGSLSRVLAQKFT